MTDLGELPKPWPEVHHLSARVWATHIDNWEGPGPLALPNCPVCDTETLLLQSRPNQPRSFKFHPCTHVIVVGAISPVEFPDVPIPRRTDSPPDGAP